jgi:tetratricopeptide (TPR) repeat protein
MHINKAIRSAIEFHREGNLKQAEHLYKKILTKKPNHSGILNKLGALSCQVANYDLAIKYLGKALRFRPADTAEAYCNLGWALREKGQVV